MVGASGNMDIPRSKLCHLEQERYIKPVSMFQSNCQIKDYPKDNFARVQTIW